MADPYTLTPGRDDCPKCKASPLISNAVSIPGIYGSAYAVCRDCGTRAEELVRIWNLHTYDDR
jgi:hypothetical protein